MSLEGRWEIQHEPYSLLGKADFTQITVNKKKVTITKAQHVARDDRMLWSMELKG